MFRKRFRGGLCFVHCYYLFLDSFTFVTKEIILAHVAKQLKRTKGKGKMNIWVLNLFMSYSMYTVRFTRWKIHVRLQRWCCWQSTLNYNMLKSIDPVTPRRAANTLIAQKSQVWWYVVTFALSPLTGVVSQAESVTTNWHNVTQCYWNHILLPVLLCSVFFDRQATKLLLFLLILCSVCSLTTFLDGAGKNRYTDIPTCRLKTRVIIRKTAFIEPRSVEGVF